MTKSYIVSGLGHTSNRILPELAEGGSCDLNLAVVFTDTLVPPPNTDLLAGTYGTSGYLDQSLEALRLEVVNGHGEHLRSDA